MFNFSDNYYLRKSYLINDQIPTQSMMKKHMGPSLAKVYFESMTPKHKVIAGLEPPMQGGGSDWYGPPKDLLQGRAVLKPVKKVVLNNLNHLGIDKLGMELFEKHCQAMEVEKVRLLTVEDINWRKHVDLACAREYMDASQEAIDKNGEFIMNAFNSFVYLYRMSFDKFETLFREAAIAEIEKIKETAFSHMQNHYAIALKFQATRLYKQYDMNLIEEKARLKSEFIKNLEECRTDFTYKMHDLKIDKHTAIEKLRQFLKCQNLACQVYVTLKEREECTKEMVETRYRHKKAVRILAEDITFKDVQIYAAEDKLKKRLELNTIWKKKVCHIVKKFQTFVTYCLSMLPDHADFFINMEKLMLLQLNETIEEPTAESIIVVDEEQSHTPVPRSNPFYLFCDKGYKAQIDQNLCPRQCTSIATQLPAIIINKRCIYASCDNFEQFSYKVKQYVYGERGDDADFVESIDSIDCVPVKYTSSQHILELKLQSSLLQILQQEVPNVRGLPINCGVCEIPHCVCVPFNQSVGTTMNKTREATTTLVTKSPAATSLKPVKGDRLMELVHNREPKWKSFLDYIDPKRCSCAKKASYLKQYLPAYMQNMSKFEPPDIPNYEMCSFEDIKKLLKQDNHPPPERAEVVQSMTKDVAIQCSDPEFDKLCTCFSEVELDRWLTDLTSALAQFDESRDQQTFGVVGSSLTPSFILKDPHTFAIDRAHSLRNIIGNEPELKQIFMKNDCTLE